MKVWAVANQKGGVGKTTTTVSLAGLLASWSRPTLLVDLDPHGSLTSYFGFDPDTIQHSIFTVFSRASKGKESDPLPLVRPTETEYLDLLPSSTALATLERQAGMRDGMGLVLARTLKRLEKRYDHVLVDCPPMLGVLMVNALAACDQLIVPVQTEFLAMKGLERMLHTLQMILRARGSSLRCTILPTLYDQRTRASVDTLRQLRESYPDKIWSSVIPVDTQFREASKLGLPPPVHSPNGRGVRAYTELLHDLLQDEQTANQELPKKVSAQ